MEQAIAFINKFSFVPTLLVAAYTLFIYKKLPAELKTFAWFVLVSGMIELISRIYWFNSKNNMPLLHLYVALGFICLSLFYQQVLNGFIDKKIIRWILIGFLAFTTVNTLFIQPIYTFNSYALMAESVIIVIFSLSTYMLMLNDIVRKKRIGLIKSLNWINSGLFIYYASSLIIFNFANLFFSDLSFKVFSKNFNIQTWVLHSFFSITMYCCFFVGLWYRPRK